MQFQGQSVTAAGASLFGFDANPFDTTAALDTRAASDALAPRHAHFEYTYSRTNLRDG